MLTVAAAATMLLIGCSGGSGDGGSDYAVIGDDPRTIVHQAAPISEREGWFLPDAGFGGDLMRDPATGCLYLDTVGDEFPQWIVAWPRGSRLVIVEGEPAVEVPGDRTRSAGGQGASAYVVEFGDRVDAGGTLLDEEYIASLRSDEAHPEVVAVLGWVEEAQEESGCGTEYPVLLIDYISIPGGDG